MWATLKRQNNGTCISPVYHLILMSPFIAGDGIKVAVVTDLWGNATGLIEGA